MAEKREYAPKIVTPVGTLRHPHLTKPDAKFNPEKPRWKAPIILTAAEAAPLVSGIETDAKFGLPAAEALRDAAIAAAKKAGKKLPANKDPANSEATMPFAGMVDPDTGDDTGNVLFTVGSNDRYTKKDGTVVKIVPAMFDAKGAAIPVARRPNLYSGTKARVSYSMFPYYNAATNQHGVSLRLEGVKVIKPVTGGGGADGSEFGGEEEGWTAPDEDPMTTDDTTGGGPAAPGDEDF